MTIELGRHKGAAVHGFTELSLENFKSHQKTGNLKLKRITILIGPNSSGKTAFFQPLLLLKQSLMSKSQAIEPLSLNGDLVSLGSFSDFVYAHNIDRVVKIKCVIETEISKAPSRVSFEFLVGYDKKEREGDSEKSKNRGPC
jgi:AAA15 family ATPase/GTPase